MNASFMNSSADTIVAAATPPGIGGIGIVRLSGRDVPALAGALLGSLPKPRFATFTLFRHPDGSLIDQGIALYFPGPGSFTGEDVLELQGHGGPVVMGELVRAAVALGARHAEPGEFSKRAFLNDKLDLVQAEAIADLIASATGQAARAALRSLAGEFSQGVTALAAELTKLRVHVEAALDFPEEEIDFLADAALTRRIDLCAAAFDDLLARASIGRVLRDGFRVVLVGSPNAGKSSLMNRLSGEETAIVTAIAGTTRDILRETIDIDGLAVELVDTAGLRDDPGVVEREGIRRAHAAMAEADAVLWIRDVTQARPEDVEGVPPGVPAGVPVIEVLNKIDLANGARSHFKRGQSAPADGKAGAALSVSALTGAGLPALRERLKALAGYRNLGEGACTARARHVEALHRARVHFDAGRRVLAERGAGELLAEELRRAQSSLGTLTGDVTSDELLGRIFSEFCIGK
jgi:tRNA modification GTPase